MRILSLAYSASNFYLWYLSFSKSRTRIKSLTWGLVYYTCIFFFYFVWFSNTNQIAKVCCSFLLSIIPSIIKPFALFFNFSISLNVVFCTGVLLSFTFYLGIYPSIISKGVKPCKQTSWPFIKEMILGILHPQIFFALGPQFSTYFLIWPMTNCTFFSTKPIEKKWLIGMQIWVVPWSSKNTVISALVKCKPLLWKKQKRNLRTEIKKLSQKL